MNCGYNEISDNTALHPTAFSRKSLLHAEWCYSTIELEALGNTTWPREVPPLLFTKEVCIITDHKALVAIIRKDVAMLTWHQQWIMLHIHQYRVHILFKPDPDLYIMDWLFWNNPTEKRDQELTAMNINADAITEYTNMHIQRR